MTTVHRTIERPLTEVFDAVADPRTYPRWLVGAKEMRSVDPSWPSPGASFRHRVGVGPLRIADRSTCCEVHRPTLLVLEVRARPLGRARVTFRLEQASPTTTELEFREVPIGPARLLAPIAAPLTAARNARSLSQLASFLHAV
jgi:uncharacterized protein YndB with AHSA1/START domain